eukprot:TRINITY_DN4485_c0_g1_i1.p1 TRINITY_DN4485_c0_g1~~TRINITY_DN4485_c0_g1_i1.p1  ORF type:complete len:134 (-),score=28.92 TRINITY_DN4485_c0_g1_i1:55-402(-)
MGLNKDSTVAERKTECAKISEKYRENVPIIVTCNSLEVEAPNRFFVMVCPQEKTLQNVIQQIRKRVQLTESQAIFLFVNKTLPIMTKNVGEMHMQYKEEDGFLHVEYSFENTFGA